MPSTCVSGILQPLGRRGSACSSRYLLLNGLPSPSGLPDLAIQPPAGLSPIVPVALATCVASCPAPPFIVRSVFAPWPVFSDHSDYCSTRVFQLAMALNRLVLHTLRCMTIQRSASYGVRPCHNRLIYGRPLPDRSGRPHAANARWTGYGSPHIHVCGLPNGHLHHLCPAPLLTPDDAVCQRLPAFSCVSASVRLALPGLPPRPEPGRFIPLQSACASCAFCWQPCGRFHSAP